MQDDQVPTIVVEVGVEIVAFILIRDRLLNADDVNVIGNDRHQKLISFCFVGNIDTTRTAGHCTALHYININDRADSFPSTILSLDEHASAAYLGIIPEEMRPME